MVKNTYGTGCFLMMNTGDKPIESKNNLVTTIAWQIGDDVQYALEGSIFIAGAVVQWLRDGVGIIKSAAEIEALAASVPHTDGVYLVPAFAGLGAPHWNARARGSVFGVTRGTTSAHLARAALDSIAYQSLDVLAAMEADSGISIGELRVDGGASANDLLMQFRRTCSASTRCVRRSPRRPRSARLPRGPRDRLLEEPRRSARPVAARSPLLAVDAEGARRTLHVGLAACGACREGMGRRRAITVRHPDEIQQHRRTAHCASPP